MELSNPWTGGVGNYRVSVPLESIENRTCLEEGLHFLAQISAQQLAQCDPAFTGDMGKQYNGINL